MAPFFISRISMIDTNLIIYTGGAYGNFINWCCSYFTGLVPTLDVPFTQYGSVHNIFPGQKHLLLPGQFKEFIEKKELAPFAQCHGFDFPNGGPPLPGEADFTAIVRNLENNNFKKSIYLYPTINSISWITNNQYFKVRPFEDLIRLGVVDPEAFLKYNGVSDNRIKILEAIGVDRLKLELSAELSQDSIGAWDHSGIDEFDIWELRELSMMYFYNRSIDNLITPSQEATLIEKFPNILFIRLDQLRTDFNKTIINILNHFDIAVKNLNEVDLLHRFWLPKQEHINKDELINDIVKALVNDIELDWSDYNITFFDEVFIQRKLLEMGIALRCYNLNKFPTTTKDFASLLIKND